MIGSKDVRFSRREFGKNLAGGEPFAKLTEFDGDLFVDRLTRDLFAQDYGQIVHRLPAAVLRPGSIDDLARIVKVARQFNLKIAARGHGHQPFGQAQVASGIAIDMTSLNVVHTLSGDQIQVDAGVEWREVVRAALSQGLMPPVLTNYLGLTVGGTLSIGGVGLSTFRYGAQVDQTLALTVVSGEGEILNCSLGERRDLFEAVLAGQGQCALIARVTLKLTPAPDMVREYLLPYADLQTILSDGAKLANDQRFDGFVALIAPTPSGWSYVLTAIRHCQWTDAPDDAALLADLRFQHGAEKIRNVGYLEYADVVPPFDPAQVHADLGLCIPQSKLEPFFTDIIDRLSPSDLGGVAAVRLFFLQRAPFTRPLLRIPSEECFSYAAILRSQTNDADTIAKQLSGNRTLFELANNVDGTLYPFAALEMHRSDWRQHYGEQWRSLMTMKRRCDPDNVFASGPNLS